MGALAHKLAVQFKQVSDDGNCEGTPEAHGASIIGPVHLGMLPHGMENVTCTAFACCLMRRGSAFFVFVCASIRNLINSRTLEWGATRRHRGREAVARMESCAACMACNGGRFTHESYGVALLLLLLCTLEAHGVLNCVATALAPAGPAIHYEHVVRVRVVVQP